MPRQLFDKKGIACSVRDNLLAPCRWELRGARDRLHHSLAILHAEGRQGELGHRGDECSFDAIVRKYGLEGDRALARLALIVRGADTSAHDLTPEKLFERRWALTLLEHVLTRLEADMGRTGKALLFARLKEHLSDEAILELTYSVVMFMAYAVLSRALRLEYDDVDERLVEVPAPAAVS